MQVDHGAPQISLAAAEFLDASKKWQEQAAHASAQAAKYAALARAMDEVYRDALARSGVPIPSVQQEADRLRKGIQDFIAGDYPNPRKERPGMCSHGIYYYHECGQCNDEYFVNLLRTDAVSMEEGLSPCGSN